MTIRNRNLYRPLIVLLLGSFLAFSAWAAWQAAERGSQVTDRDYYSKGLKYNSSLVEKRAAEVLGWSLATEIAGQSLIFQLADSDHQSVAGARAILHLYLPDTRNGRAFTLDEFSAGEYRLELPAGLSGSMRARVSFERDGARLNRQLQLNL